MNLFIMVAHSCHNKIKNLQHYKIENSQQDRAVEKEGEGAPVPPPFPGAKKLFFPRKIQKHKIFTCE